MPRQMTAEDQRADPGGDEARPGDVRAAAGRRPSRGGRRRRRTSARPRSSRREEEVVDAEFSEVDEENKG